MSKYWFLFAFIQIPKMELCYYGPSQVSLFRQNLFNFGAAFVPHILI